MKNTQEKIKPIKTGRQPGTTYRLILLIILGHKKYKWQVKCSEKNQSLLFVGQISQSF